jgi:hypothetical protein
MRKLLLNQRLKGTSIVPLMKMTKYANKYAKQEVLGIKISTALSKILMDYLRATISAADRLRAKVVGKGNNPWLCEIEQAPEEPLD